MKYAALAAALLISGPAFADTASPEPSGAPTKTASGAAANQTPAEKAFTIAPPDFSKVDPLAGGFDYAYGSKLLSDYIFRGITQTAHRPGATAYGEARYGWFYVGVQPWSVQLPTDPFAEVDIYAGVRPTFGPLAFDFGAIYYLYPGNRIRYFLGGAQPVLTFFTPGGVPTTASNPSFLELYAKTTYQLNDYLSIGANVNYDPNWNNYGAQAVYYEGNAKLTFPDTGFSVSGAVGRYEIGYGNPLIYGASIIDPKQALLPFNGRGFKFASYTTYNVGGTYNYKAFTFDLRLSGTNLSRAACAVTSSDPAANFAFGTGRVGQSDWCSTRVFATVSVDFTSTTFK